MQSGNINITKKIKLCLLLGLLCLGVSEAAYATHGDRSEKTVNGIRYFLFSRWIDPQEWDKIPDGLPNLNFYGFKVNTDDEGTYIAPDGKIVPKFDYAWWTVAPNAYNYEDNWGKPPVHDAPSSYSGDVFLPDTICRRVLDTDWYWYVLGFRSGVMAEGLTSIRTPLYAKIRPANFQNAVNLKKVQIGACYAVEPFAFINCAKLGTVIFEKAPFVYDDAFTDCVGIKMVVLQSGLPALESASAFEDCVYEKATLYLPDELMDECAADPVWSRFVHKRSLKEYNFGVIVSTLISTLSQLMQ